MVTVTIHIQSYNVCSGCPFDEQLYRSWTFLQIPSKTLHIGHRLFRRFLHVSRQLLCRIRQIWSVLRQVRCSHHHATILSRLQCVQLWRCHQHLFQPFFRLTKSSLPFTISRFNNLTVNSACRKIWFILNPTPFPIRVPTHVSIQDSHLLLNFTQRFFVTQGYQIGLRVPP